MKSNRNHDHNESQNYFKLHFLFQTETVVLYFPGLPDCECHIIVTQSHQPAACRFQSVLFPLNGNQIPEPGLPIEKLLRNFSKADNLFCAAAAQNRISKAPIRKYHVHSTDRRTLGFFPHCHTTKRSFECGSRFPLINSLSK